jgi:endogenous inhibitor of DNA gyrase (YacG/DUF329 family)
MTDEPKSSAQERKCPLCGKPAHERYRPFCSKRCADVDLNRWLKGSYAIPSKPDDDEQDSQVMPGGTGEEAE